MMAQRLIDPCAKLATTRAWHTSTLAEELGIQEPTEQEEKREGICVLRTREATARRIEPFPRGNNPA